MCAKCGHPHEGGPCRARVGPLECICWVYEPASARVKRPIKRPPDNTPSPV